MGIMKIKFTVNRTPAFLFTIFAISFLQACVIQPPPKPGDPYYSPVISASPRPEQSVGGSLYKTGMGLSLYGDTKAARVGDVITIMLDERTVSSKSSSTSVTKDSEVSFSEDSGGNTLLGSNPTFKNLSLLTDLTQERDFSGAAGADQSNRLQGSITVTVADILPNGNMVIRGEKWMALNQGDEYIRISGIIRPADISPQNTVPSTKIANARITYSGTGSLADSQTMGWLSKVFNSVFWPF
ncbi:flagellar basal body L-ring protein FlgH [Aurantivibrio infirmus]